MKLDGLFENCNDKLIIIIIIIIIIIMYQCINEKKWKKKLKTKQISHFQRWLRDNLKEIIKLKKLMNFLDYYS